MKHIIVTIPKSIKWDDYTNELRAAETGQILNFKTKYFPLELVFGKSKCYICHDGIIRGYHYISRVSCKSFKCTTTGKLWTGKFIERTGQFYPINDKYMSGFRGFKYIDDIG